MPPNHLSMSMKEFLARGEFQGINETEAKCFGLERVEIESNKEAQELMSRVFDRTRSDCFDVTTEAGQQAFNAAWKQNCPDILPPNGNSFWYLKQLQAGKIISNLDLNNLPPSSPDFNKRSILWMQDWQEGDYDIAGDSIAVRLVLECNK